MWRKQLLVIAILAITLPAAAQSIAAYKRAGDRAYDQKNYHVAIQHYATILGNKPDNAAVLWKFAESMRMLYAFEEAEKAYRRLLAREKERSDYPLLNFRLGEVVKNQGNYEEAIAAFEAFVQEGGADSLYLKQAALELEACRWAQAQTPRPGLEIKPLDKKVNSPYSDFAPTVRGDTLIFSSYRFDDKKAPKDSPRKLTRLMMSVREGRAREPGRGWPVADTAHIAHAALTPDGHFLFYTVCKNVNARDIRCELWLMIKDRRNRWTPPQRLPAPINQPGYTTTHPSIGYDKFYSGPVLWFASDRPGGKGGLDLWYVPLDTNYFCPCSLPLPNKKVDPVSPFPNPINAAAVNTSRDDATPFFHEATQTLYFSSEGWPGMGGYDLFYAQKTGKTISAPVNAGAGLNSSYNDLYPYVRPNGLSGYFSSNRPGSQYLDEASKACCNDLFAFQQQPPPPPPPPPGRDSLPPLSVTPQARGVQPPPPAQPAEPTQLKSFVGLPLFFDNDEPDKRTRRTTTKKNYEETVLAYLDRQEEYRQRFSEKLNGTSKEKAEDQIDQFFDNEVRQGYERLGQLCDILYIRLRGGERIAVIIKGFTSPRAENNYNLNLGRRRISSVYNFIASYDNGVLLPYLQDGRLKVQEASFGETTAREGISDDLRDERNSIYHPDAARERRVEIVEIRENQ